MVFGFRGGGREMSKAAKLLTVSVILFSMLGCKPLPELRALPSVLADGSPAVSFPSGKASAQLAGRGSDSSPVEKIRVETLRPNGNGNETSIDYQYPLSSWHWDKLVDVTADQADTYIQNRHGTPGTWQRDLYTVDNHNLGSGNIHGVTIHLRTAGTESGLKIAIRTHSTTYEQEVPGSSSWNTVSYAWEKNPSTNKSWTWEEIDAMEFGVSLAGNDVSINKTYQYSPYIIPNPSHLPTTTPPLGPLPVWPPYVTPGRPMATQIYTEVEYSDSLLYETLRPNGAGDVTAIGLQSPGTGSHWEKVADFVPDEDATFIENTGSDRSTFQKDLFTLQDPDLHSGNISTVTVYVRTKHNASNLKVLLRANNTTIEQYMPVCYAYWATQSYTWTENPATNKSWTWDEIDALEAGIALSGSSAGPSWSRCTQVYVRVGYEPGKDDHGDKTTGQIQSQITAGPDDISAFFNGKWNLWDTGLAMTEEVGGRWNDTEERYVTGLRFTNVNIPKDAVITSATVNFVSDQTNTAGTVNTKFTGQAADNPGPFTTLADLQARRGTLMGGHDDLNLTTAQVNWDNITSWYAGGFYSSPDLSTIVQEIVDRKEWTLGNPIVIFWDDADGRSTGDKAVRSAFSFDWNLANAPILTITWELP